MQTHTHITLIYFSGAASVCVCVRMMSEDLDGFIPPAPSTQAPGLPPLDPSAWERPQYQASDGTTPP